MTRPWLTRMTSMAAATGVLGLQSCGPPPAPNPKEAASYVPLCSTALTKVQFDAHLLEGANLTANDPGIVQQGPPVRVMCGASKGTHIAVITFDAVCDDYSEKACASIVSVDLDQTRISGPIA